MESTKVGSRGPSLAMEAATYCSSGRTWSFASMFRLTASMAVCTRCAMAVADDAEELDAARISMVAGTHD